MPAEERVPEDRRFPHGPHDVPPFRAEPEAAATACTLSWGNPRLGTGHVVYLGVKARLGCSVWSCVAGAQPRMCGSGENESHICLFSVSIKWGS